MKTKNVAVRIDVEDYLKIRENIAHAAGLLSGLRMSMDEFQEGDEDVLKRASTSLFEISEILKECEIIQFTPPVKETPKETK